MKRKKRRKASEVAKLKRRLEQLNRSLVVAEKEETKLKIKLQILLTEELIEKAKFHRLSGFSQIRGYEIPAGAPGLGKRS